MFYTSLHPETIAHNPIQPTWSVGYFHLLYRLSQMVSQMVKVVKYADDLKSPDLIPGEGPTSCLCICWQLFAFSPFHSFTFYWLVEFLVTYWCQQCGVVSIKWKHSAGCQIKLLLFNLTFHFWLWTNGSTLLVARSNRQKQISSLMSVILSPI